nr:methyltransferase domain-containing protein [uncultured Rhodoferax sp.]
MTDHVQGQDSDLLLIAPDAIIRFISGRMFVHTGSGPRMYSTDDAAMINVLAHFSRPTTVLQAMADQPIAHQPHYRTAIEQLRQIRALVPTGTQQDLLVADSAPPPVDSQLALLADSIQRIGGGLSAMGPYAGQELDTRPNSVSLLQRLTALVAGITALEAELTAMRPGFISAQLQTLGLAEKPRGLKLHLGSGATRLPGWVNIDAYPAELSLDLRWGLPFDPQSADYVFMSHVFEHLYYPEESSGVLRDIHRVLSPGGRLRLIVPDIELCIRAYSEHDTAFMENRQHTWAWWPAAATRLEDFLAYAGAGPRASHFLEGHKFGYDFETLSHALRAAGFSDIQRSSYMGSQDPVLQVDNASSVAGAQSNGQYYSLFVEARK